PFDRKEGSAAPPGGSADFGRRGRQDPASARLDAALRRFANDCGERARLGAQARHRTLDDVASAAPEQKRMRIGRPRTLLGLVLFGLAVVTLPLLIAVGHAVLQLQQLADESEIVVTRSQTATLENQRIASQLADMERNARQYYALQNRELLALYDDAHQTLTASLAALRPLAQSRALHAELDRLATLAKGAQSTVHRGSDGSLDQVIESFRAMNAAARDVQQGLRTEINEQLDALQESTRDAQQTLAWQSML